MSFPGGYFTNIFHLTFILVSFLGKKYAIIFVSLKTKIIITTAKARGYGVKKSQMARIVKFDALVSEGAYPSVGRFSDDYMISRRTIARDIEYLRDRLGAPLEYDMERNGYYYSKPWNLPKVVTLSVEQDPISYIIEQFKKLSDTDREIVIQSLRESTPHAESAKCLTPAMVA